MLPSAEGIHGFEGVQAAFLLYLGFALLITGGLWWFGLPTKVVLVAFLAVCAVLLLPFRSVFRNLHPERPGGE